tara:strand:- start:891 stop:1790 length:900 start_codon:yes stop_codon:yes gene_type:complete
MKRQGNPAVIGVFVVTSVAVLLGFTLFTGGLSGFRDENERFVLTFEENIYGLYKGSKVTLGGVQIGRVERFFIGQTEKEGGMQVLVEIDRDLVNAHKTSEVSSLFDEQGRFTNEALQRIRGRLETESYVTGILYVNLEYLPEVEPAEIQEVEGYFEISTRVSELKEFTDSLDPQHLGRKVNELLETANKRLDELDVERISTSFQDSSVALQKFLDDFNTKIAPPIVATSEEARLALVQMRELSAVLKTMLDSDSEFSSGISKILYQIDKTMKSMQELVDFIQRNPSSFLRGTGSPRRKE